MPVIDAGACVKGGLAIAALLGLVAWLARRMAYGKVADELRPGRRYQDDEKGGDAP